jgi:hypothetical protein
VSSVSCTVGCSSDEVPEELLVGTAGFNSYALSRKRRPCIRVKSARASERLNRVAGFC